MIYKRNRLYFNDTEYLKILDYYIHEIDNEGIGGLKEFLKDITMVYTGFKFTWKIRKPNLKYIMIFIKINVYDIEDKFYERDKIKLHNYIDLYRNDEN